ncbi:MAG: PLP-dependent aminotransferase family protein [Trueperaceae bacterium]
MDTRAPRWRTVYRDLRDAVVSGALAPGTRLPSTRAHAEALGVSRNTVLAAYEQLTAEGYVEARVGAGTFVVGQPAPPDRALEAPETAPARAPISAFGHRAVASRPGTPYREAGLPYDFRYGRVPSEIGLAGRWRRLLASTPAPLDYGDAAGYLPLRRSLAGYLRRRRGVRLNPDDVIVTTGSQQALDLLARVLLDPEDGVLLEDPAYQGARQAFAAHGARLYPMPVDEEGARVPEAIPERVRLAYVTPSHQFPTGVVLSFARRQTLLASAERHGYWVVEDDYDAEFRYDVRPVPALQGLDAAGRVAYVGTFSKVLFPALRLGYLVAPLALREALLAAKWLADRHTATIEQAAMAELIDTGRFERHLAAARRLHAQRRVALVTSLADRFGRSARVMGTSTGVHALVRHPDLPSDRTAALVRAAFERGVGLYPSTPYYLGEPPAMAELVVGYGALAPDAIREGVARWAAAYGQIVPGSAREPGDGNVQRS